MLTPARRTAPLLPLGLVALGLTVAACSGGSPSGPTSSSPAASAPSTAADGAGDGFGDGYGASAGAAEMTEAQLRLAVVAPDGRTTGIDLLTGGPLELPDLPAPDTVSTDGRYLFATAPDGLTVLDTGAWTVPHGDHSHYYLAEPRLMGPIPAGTDTRAASAIATVALLDPATGHGTVLDGAALGDGEITSTATDVEAAGVLVPLGEQLIAGTAAADAVRVLDATGTPVPGAEVGCPDLAGTITSRVGVVVGCADGAVLATAGATADDPVTLDHIAYPEPVAAAERAREFAARKDRPSVAALAGERGAWVLDTRNRAWSLLETPVPLLAVTAVDDRDHTVVAVDRDGRILTLDAETGAVTGSSEPLLADSVADPVLREAVTIEVDANRAYVNDPAGRRVLEIDHGDAARISREFATPDVPLFLAESGR
ncbi:hypothetical protein [Nakamurella leprariae]|uniref:ABC transporter n=1 Tax=Nakamurella leprariae TaxID=2803911 RepID=A0A939BVD5_9ACTN|nr:hypothetical protein [Nakamurella leprariae]MBM9466403.1 hypothetical protein [Nakamurella leprariae]